ncbi:MAG TPA: 4-hydroxy-tetrahydrodipicolinate synthase [Spirochaetota bacterium]|nr:4-hydroxy-tetrahydrodipicolinate synthase [Spirochaetota bacterium]
MFSGLYTAMVTPFANGKIDYDAVKKIIEMQIKAGVDGIVPMGTTGESPTVSFEEHKEFIKEVVSMVNGRVKIIAGTGSNSTEEAICLSQSAENNGVDALLLVNPYYNKPTQKGLVAHFETIARAVSIPIVLYNIPGRTGVNFLPESVFELINRVPNIVAIKEATGDIAQMMRVIELCGEKLTLLSGDDNLLLPVLGIGGKGVISVLSNLIPADIKKIITSFNEGNINECRSLFYKLLPLCRAMFLETNPIPVKAGMELLGYCSSELRLPMTEISEQNRAILRKSLIDYGISL